MSPTRTDLADRIRSGHGEPDPVEPPEDGDGWPPEPERMACYGDSMTAAEPEPDGPARDPVDGDGWSRLLFESVADVAARVDAAPPPGWLARPVWPVDAYGVIAAEDKAGKSWAVLDLAVAVASGRKWLDRFECERPGPVLVFLGEGSERKSTRRGRAVAEFHGETWEHLPIRVSHRAPDLTRDEHLAAIAYELEQNPARLVILDPLYLSLGNTKSGLLSEMGAVLVRLQVVCQQADAALVVVHHWNQTGTGTDRKRFSGAGLAEWGRVLVSVAVDGRSTTDGDDSIVEQSWRFIGDEIPDTTHRVVRRIWTDDPDSLTSAMHYAVMPAENGPYVVADDYDRDGEIGEHVLAALADGNELSGSKLIDAIRDAGHKARDRDVRRVAAALATEGALTIRSGPNNSLLHRIAGGAQ